MKDKDNSFLSSRIKRVSRDDKWKATRAPIEIQEWSVIVDDVSTDDGYIERRNNQLKPLCQLYKRGNHTIPL